VKVERYDEGGALGASSVHDPASVVSADPPGEEDD
jgi:hypothetical protein